MRRMLQPRFGRAVAGAMLAIALGGCFWTQPGQNADRQAYNSQEDQITLATVGALELAWEAPADAGPMGDPVTSWVGVHANGGGSVYGFDPADGAELWQYSVAAPATLGQPFVREDEVLVGQARSPVPIAEFHEAGTVTLDAGSGAVHGTDDSGAIRGLRGSRALFVDAAWYRFGLLQPAWVWIVHMAVEDLDSGELLHHVQFDTGDASQTLSLDMTLGSGWVFLSHLAGTPPIPGGPPPGFRGYSFSRGAPPGCTVVVCPTWAHDDHPESRAPALSDDGATVYTTSLWEPLVIAVDAATGTTQWTGTLSAPTQALPALANDLLYVPTDAGTIDVFDVDGCGSATCAPLWTASTGTGSPISRQPAVAGGVVFTGSEDGSVHAFDAAGCATPPCAPLWSASTGSAITGAPAVSDGQLYVGTADGRLMAYSLPG